MVRQLLFNSLHKMVAVGMKSNIHLHRFSQSDLLVAELAASILKNLEEAITAKGKASLLVSGGSTPKKLFEKLSKSDIAWENVTIGLVDERWVDANHDDSNAKLVATHLLQNHASKASFSPMYIENVEAIDAESACEQNMKASLAPFDVIILGMGGDAHTASLFPDNERLEQAYDMNSEKVCIAIEPATAPHMRMSLTLQAILHVKHLYLHIEGEEKLHVFNDALNGDAYKQPISTILNQDLCDVEVYHA
jgi:6-phosphogluconolactonase